MVVLTSFTQPTDGIRHRQQNTTVYVNDNNLGKGTLYIAESRLSWIGETGNGFSIEYPHISLHAISRDLTTFPQECLFLMLDTSLMDEDQNIGEEDDDDDSSKQETTEMRLVPDDRGMLDAMFHAMNACQALHPDPEDSFSDEDFFEDADDGILLQEADFQMGRLRIGNMDGTAHIGGRVEDMVGGVQEDTRENIALNIAAEDRLGILGGILGGTGAGRVGGRLGISEGTGADRAGGILGGTEAGSILGGTEAGSILEGRVGGRAAGILGGRAAGILGGTEAGNILEGRVGGMEAGILGDTEAGILGGRAAGTEEGISVYTGVRTPRGDRSYFLGHMSHRNRTAGSPQAQIPHTVLDSHFDDAEN